MGIVVSVEIDATPERVWEVVEPVERHVDWMHDAVAHESVPDAIHNGASEASVTRIGH